MMQSESVIILTPSYQLYCFFTCQMLDVKADGQHMSQSAFNLFLQGFVLIRIVAVAELSSSESCWRLRLIFLNSILL